MFWQRKRKSAIINLTNQTQRTKTSSSFSSCCDINTGVPQGEEDQGLILGSLLFNISINY